MSLWRGFPSPFKEPTLSEKEFEDWLEKWKRGGELVFMPNDSQSSFRYITHARTLDELRQEFLSDIKRRLSGCDQQIKFAKNAREQAQIARAIAELEDLARFWQSVELRGARKPKVEHQNP